jgi:hypothetical protein
MDVSSLSAHCIDKVKVGLATQVGNAFVNQYYNVLHQSPLVVHRFYTDASRLTRAEAGTDGAVDTVVTQTEIHDKVMSLDYSDFKAEIKTVDSQESLMGGVLVMVSGSLSTKSTGKRNFTQTFFLAPQEKGYFVLNDIFRYLDEAPLVSKPAPSLPNGVAEPPLAPYVPEPGTLAKLTPVQALSVVIVWTLYFVWIFVSFYCFGL